MGKYWRELTIEEVAILKARGLLLGYDHISGISGYYWRETGYGHERLDINTLTPITDPTEVHDRQRRANGDYLYD